MATLLVATAMATLGGEGGGGGGGAGGLKGEGAKVVYGTSQRT